MYQGFTEIQVRKHQVIFGSVDMKRFQQLLKKPGDEDRSKICIEKDEGQVRQNKGPEGGPNLSRRHPTIFQARNESTTVIGHQVSHSAYILTSYYLIKKEVCKEKNNDGNTVYW